MAPIASLLLAVISDPEIRLRVEHQGALVLGTVDEVPVTIYAPEVEEERPLRVSVNVGSFTEVARREPGVYATSFRLPLTKHPQVALVAVWRETGPSAAITFLRIPLSGRTKLPVGTRRGASVSAMVGGETFGPITADRKGRASVSIVVPPGVLDVVARSTSGTTESQKTVPVDLPPYNKLTLAVTPYLIEADGHSSCTAHVFYDSDAPPPISEVKIDAPGGTIAPLGGEKGHYRFRYVPERGKSETEVELVARIEGDDTSKAKATLSLGSPVPQQLIIRSGGEPLIAGAGSQSELSILLMDRFGLGVPGRALTATTSGGRTGELRDQGEGRYTLRYHSPERYPEGGIATVSVSVADRVQVRGSIQVPIAPPPWPAKAFVSIDPSIPISDGSSFTVDVTATDFAGRPFDSGVVLTASAADVSPIQHVGEGRYRAVVKPPEGAESIDLEIKHPSGKFSQLHRTVLRAPPATLSIGAKIGGAWHESFSFAGALELDLRLPFGERRFSIFASIGFRQAAQVKPVSLASLPESSSLRSRIRMLPINIGFAYDYLVGESWRAYFGVAGSVIPFEHRAETELSETPVDYSVGGGGEGALGFEWIGIFVEAAGGYTIIRTEELKPGPEALAQLVVGYRLGIF